jgi:hypothetical protein
LLSDGEAFLGLFSAVFEGGCGSRGVFWMVFYGEFVVFWWWGCGFWMGVFCGLKFVIFLKYFCGNPAGSGYDGLPSRGNNKSRSPSGMTSKKSYNNCAPHDEGTTETRSGSGVFRSRFWFGVGEG